jgi:hypothetical protein
MNLVTVLLVAAALIGVGVWGALAQQTFVMLMMGIELMLNGVMVAVGGFWAYTGGGLPRSDPGDHHDGGHGDRDGDRLRIGGGGVPRTPGRHDRGHRIAEGMTQP